MYVYCVYPAISKSPKHLSNCLNRAETNDVEIIFDGVLCDVCTYTLYCFCFLPSLNMNQVPEKLYLGQWLYKKNLSNQCCLTAQIEPVQDKMNIFVHENSTKNYK
jgi:hypothetical protein